MPRRYTGDNVFNAAIDRMVEIYDGGHRVVVSFSAGKDSTVALHVCILAAEQTGRLPVEVIMRDEEIMFPGTFEYAERVAQWPEVSFNWIYACQPIINVCNREQPYWWVFDPLLDPEQWVRQPPAIAYQIPDKNIEMMTIPDRFPPDEGKDLYSVIGLRTQESRGRNMTIYSSKGHTTKPNQYGVIHARPVYDWNDGDVWKAIQMFGWDYNRAYDTMLKMGVSRNKLRIAPPTMSTSGLDTLKLAADAWPQWFEKVARRCPGIRQAAHYGKRALQPIRRTNESWKDAYIRMCITEAPAWIAERGKAYMDLRLREHAAHSPTDLPEVAPCMLCGGGNGVTGSWKAMLQIMYTGDPFSFKNRRLDVIEPEFFRPGSGVWGGKPSF